LPLAGGVVFCEIMARLARVVAPGFPHHVTQRADRLLSPSFPPPHWKAMIPAEVPGETTVIRPNTHTGRLVLRSEAAPPLRGVAPCGAPDFVRRLVTLLGRPPLPQKPGRKPRDSHKTTRKGRNA